MDYDIIVCGAGVQGLWTANYLAEKKKKVLLLEQFPWPHNRGSSHGDSRITRYSYPTKHHSMMMRECFTKWNNLQQTHGKEIFVNCGVLMAGKRQYVKRVSDSLKSNGHEHDYLSSSDLNSKFEGLNSGGLEAIYEQSGGVLKANLCLQLLQKSFLEAGGIFQDCEKVESLHPISDQEVVIVTNKGNYRCHSVVLTCGPWINKILKPLQLILPIKAIKISVVYWKALDPKLYDIKRFPSTVFDTGLSHYYSTPIMEYPGLMKFCCHYGVETDPDYRDGLNEGSKKIEKENLRVLSTMVEKHFPGLQPQPAVIESCIYSLTPDSDFILDCHPVFKNVVIGAGFSGHGFKLSPMIGRILGQLALSEKPSLQHHFAMSRFISKPNL